MTSDLPLVTVVTPTLDRATSLPRCLDSVEAQTYPNIEHVVVDGGSTDGSIELLERRAARGGLRFSSGPDRGMYDAINKGMASAKGQILAYLNSDDAYLPWTIATAVDALAQGADMVFGDLARVEDKGDRATVALQFYPPFDLNHYTHVQALAQPTVVWHRRVTDENGLFDDSYRLLGDCEYWLRAGAAGYRIEHLQEIQAVQFDHDQTLRVTQEPRMRQEFRRLRADYLRVAGAPRSPSVEHVLRSVRWRWNQMLLRREISRAQPRRWPHFIGFLRQQGITVDGRGLLLFQLPERWRPPTTTWLDARDFEAGLDAAIATSAAP